MSDPHSGLVPSKKYYGLGCQSEEDRKLRRQGDTSKGNFWLLTLAPFCNSSYINARDH